MMMLTIVCDCESLHPLFLATKLVIKQQQRRNIERNIVISTDQKSRNGCPSESQLQIHDHIFTQLPANYSAAPLATNNNSLEIVKHNLQLTRRAFSVMGSHRWTVVAHQICNLKTYSASVCLAS